VTDIKVIDTSALAALVFAEPSGDAVAARLRCGRLVAPTLLAYEMTSVCLAKIRANPAQRSLLLDAFAAWTEIGLDLVEVDHQRALPAAEQFALSSYDVSFLWLAHRLGAELVTLDRRLARAHALQREG